MSRPDVSDPALITAFEDVRNDKTPTNWVLYGYVPKTSKIKIDCKGNGTSFYEMTDNISDGKIHYGFFRFNVNGVYKFVFVAWCGEGVSGMPKGWFNSHSVFMSKFLHGFHVQINARTEEDLEEENILSKLKVATASHGRKSDLKDQTTESRPQTSTASAGTASGSTWKGISKEASEGYWDKVRREEDEDKARREAADKANLSRNDPSLQRAGASTTRAQFENPQSQQSVPPPQRSAPPPQQQYQAPPPQQQYQAPPPQQQEEEESYQEEQSYQEEEQSYQQEEEQSYQQEEEQDYGGNSGLGTCKALYDYAGDNEGDLAFNEGDVITILDNSDASGWWQGELNGQQGYFPSNFVQTL